MKIGDKVYVIDWGRQYTVTKQWEKNHYKSIFPWKVEIPNRSGPEFHRKFIREPRLTAKGVSYKNGDTILKEVIDTYKNYKYTVVDIIEHPVLVSLVLQNERVHTILLIKSENNCYVQIDVEGVSFLTPEQYADKEFDALIAYHKGKYSANRMDETDKFPEELLKQVYDKDDRVLLGSSVIKGKVVYSYIPEVFMEDGIPLIINTQVSYDGKGNSDLPEDAELMHFRDLKHKFTNNNFK